MKKELSNQSRISRVGLCYFILMLLTQLLQFGGVALLGDLIYTTSWGLWALSYVPLYCMAVPVFLLMMQKLIPNAPGRFGTQRLSAGGWVRWVVISLSATYILNYVSTFITQLLAQLKGGAVENPLATIQQNSSPLMMLLFAGIIAPVGEEFLFRKLLHDKLGGCGEKLYILMGGFIFAMFHANLSQLLYAFVLGAVFCYIYVRTGKLRYTIALHITINVIGSVLMPSLAESDSEVVIGIVGLFLLAVIVAGVILAVRGRWKFPPELPQAGFAPGISPEGFGQGMLQQGFGQVPPRAETGEKMPWERPDVGEAFTPEAPTQKTMPQPAPTFGGALLAPGMIAYTALCIVLILITTFLA